MKKMALNHKHILQRSKFVASDSVQSSRITEMAKESVEFKDLTKKLPFRRSRPLFKTKVFGLENITGKETVAGFVHIGCLMENKNGIQEKKILTTLRDFTSGKDATVWIFINLAVYFGLPISECLPECVVAQVFVLEKCNKPPFILTLYQDNTKQELKNVPCRKRSAVIDEFPLKRTSPDKATNSKPQDKISATETETKVRSFTVKVAKELCTLLSNFCSCEFVILPCTLSYEDFLHNQSSLDDELKEQLLHTHSFYNGPNVLDSKRYDDLSRAVRVVQGMSSIPYQLKDTTTEDSLVVLDSAWQEAMQKAIVHLMSSCKQWHCTKENEFKVMVAVLEAARRISFSFKIEVRTPNENVIRCLRYVKELTKKETGISLNLEAVFMKNDCEYDSLGIQRGIHLASDDDREGKKILLSCTVNAATDETYQNKHEQTQFGAIEVDRIQSKYERPILRCKRREPRIRLALPQICLAVPLICLADPLKPLGSKINHDGKLTLKELRDSTKKSKVDDLKTQPKRKTKSKTE